MQQRDNVTTLGSGTSRLIYVNLQYLDATPNILATIIPRPSENTSTGVTSIGVTCAAVFANTRGYDFLIREGVSAECDPVLICRAGRLCTSQPYGMSTTVQVLVGALLFGEC